MLQLYLVRPGRIMTCQIYIDDIWDFSFDKSEFK